jgi:hypothetical protein
MKALLDENKTQRADIAALMKHVDVQNTKIASHSREINEQKEKTAFLSHAVFRLSCNRAIVLATQVLYLHIGRQPKAIKKGPRVFEKALQSDGKYFFLIANLFGADTIESQAKLTVRFDRLLDTRNALVHPSSLDVLTPEARDLVATLDAFVRAGHALGESEATARMVLAAIY